MGPHLDLTVGHMAHLALQVHRVQGDENGEKEYVVSNLRRFDMVCGLYDRRTGEFAGQPLDLQVGRPSPNIGSHPIGSHPI